MNNIGTKTLETERLILRRFCMEDAEPMFRNWTSDSEVAKFVRWKQHTDSEETKDLLDSWIKRYSDTAYYNWAIKLKQTREVIGNISVIKLDEEIEAAEIGYCMGKNWWGQAIMPEALRAVIRFLFDKVGMNRIAACHDSNNAKSGRVMISLTMPSRTRREWRILANHFVSRPRLASARLRPLALFFAKIHHARSEISNQLFCE